MPEPDPKPKWRAVFHIQVNRRRLDVLGDSGCSGSCMSLDYFRKHPELKQTFVPAKSSGTAINGSDVPSIGWLKLKFSIANVPMWIDCKVVEGLMDPIILGWDWMFKYKVLMDPAHGKMHFLDKYSVPLLVNAFSLSGCYYRAPEELILPPFSKVHADAELILDGYSFGKFRPSVVTEPFQCNGENFWAARACSKVDGNRFMTEYINATDKNIRVAAGHVIGFAEFIHDSSLEAAARATEMFCSYRMCDPDEYPEEHADGEIGEIILDPSPPKVVRFDMGATSFDDEVESKDESQPIPPGAKKLEVDYSKMAEDARPYTERLKYLIDVKHARAFSQHDRDYGKTTLIQYRAHIKDPDQTPLHQKPYRTRPEMREAIDQQAQQMIADGLVGHSKSPFAAPILLAKKKCGGWRFLTDFRKINERCHKVVYPLPRIDDTIQKLENPKFFTSMDLTKGFWQIPIHPDDRKYFAFSTESLHLEYLVAPMGAKNSPAYLSSLMQIVLKGLPIQHVLSYLDDILVADTNMEDHLKHLDLVLGALVRAGLKLNPAKCAFARSSVVCLGHLLSRDGISPDPTNIDKIETWKPPKNVRKLRTFLGLTGYYRQYVQGYSEIANCLTDLTRNDAKWVWKDPHQKAFETLRAKLISAPIMAYPDFSLPFRVKTDASLTAIGYVLTQIVDKKERVIAYGSKKLNDQQCKWSTYDREYFAIIAAVRANAHYLRHNKFVIITDHRPLLAWRKVDSRKDPTGRRTRWALELDNYEFDLVHKKGANHSDADAMSRRGDEDDEVAEDEDYFQLRSLFSDESAASQKALPPDNLFFMGEDHIVTGPLAALNADDGECERLRERQNDDAILSEVKAYIQNRRVLPSSYPHRWYRDNFKHFVLRDGILYRKAYSPTVHANTLQAVIPQAMVPEILRDLHGTKWVGHPKTEKMIQMAKRYANWPTLPKDIRAYVTNCQICDQLSRQNPRPKTPLQPIVARRVFDHVMCDLLSFPTPSYGFNYLLVFKDVFSGFMKC